MHNAPHMLSHNGKTNVVGTGVSALSMDATVERVLNPPADGAYVAVANVHSLMMSRSNPALAAAMADADMVTPDGMPLVWALKGMGHSDQERVHGMALATKAIERGLGSGVRHYFYGSSPATLAALESNLLASYPELALAGTYSPPFRPLTDEEAAEDAARILASGAQVVWVGLGAPKQELWMARMHPLLPGVTLVGVGAVFDWFAGNVTKAPDWMQKAGLEWLYRLSREPRRLWRRYIWNNPAYLGLLGLQLARHKLKR
jgi:N-acetylglucosaminyldiphosphoundecaprenol N-acetyl-beta-D-mannosaminyltransferase